jgi:hypothetical protein
VLYRVSLKSGPMFEVSNIRYDYGYRNGIDDSLCDLDRCCGLQAIKYCANSPLARIGAQVPAWLAPMTDKQSLLPARAGRIDKFIAA